VIIEAIQNGNNTYLAALPVTQSIEVTKGSQSISFGEIEDMNVDDAPVELTAVSTSGLPVSYRIVNGPATIDGNILTITGAGSVTVEALQSGNDNYEAADPVRQRFDVVNMVKLNQTINFGTLGYKTFTSPDFTISATSSSGLPVSFRVISGPVILSGDVVSIYGIGNVTIEAFQPGNTAFKAASPVRRSFTVGKAGQLLTFPAIANKTTGDAPFALDATASSGLPAVYKVVSGPATIAGNMVTVTGAGAVTIEASQPGDENYTAAFTLQRSFVVVPASNNLLTTTAPLSPLQGGRTGAPEVAEVKSVIAVYPNPVIADATINITVAKSTEAALEVVDMSGRIAQSFGTRRFESGQVNMIRLDASRFTSGMYFIRLAGKEGLVISQRFQVVR
jgi:hypothetical protein